MSINYFLAIETIMIHNQIINSKIINPNDYAYPSSIQFSPYNNVFRKGDYVSVVSCKLKDLFTTTGKVLITNTVTTAMNNISFNYSIENYNDIVMEFQTQTTMVTLVP